LNISVHEDLGDFANEFQGKLFHNTKSWLFIDGPTSKTHVILQMMMDMVEILPKGDLAKFLVVVSAGPRIDLAASVTAKARALWPKWPQYVITLTSEVAQGARKRPSYMVVVQGPGFAKDSVPFQCDAGSFAQAPTSALCGSRVQAPGSWGRDEGDARCSR
jgi:hypothetical protein